MRPLSSIPTHAVNSAVVSYDPRIEDLRQSPPMENVKLVGQQVATLRKKLRMTQTELADAIGVQRSILGEIETGTQPGGLATMLALADYFKVPLDWLLCRKPPLGGPLAGHFVDDPDELAWLRFWQDMDDIERRGMLSFLRGSTGRRTAP